MARYTKVAPEREPTAVRGSLEQVLCWVTETATCQHASCPREASVWAARAHELRAGYPPRCVLDRHGPLRCSRPQSTTSEPFQRVPRPGRRPHGRRPGTAATEASARTRRTPQGHAADAYGTSFLKRGKSNWCIKRQEAAYFGGRRTRVESSLV